MKTLHNKRFPNESDEYRRARNVLLEFEVDLRARIDALGKMRRELPPGGALKEDYVFQEMVAGGTIRDVAFSELFAPAKPALFAYSFMFGPDMAQPCPACTSLIDGFSGIAQHLADRINMVVIVKSPIERVMEFAESRPWANIRLLSSANNTYNADYFGENADGVQIPAANVFTQSTQGIHHFFSTELLYADLQGHPRHMDLAWPIWNILDMTPEGRGVDWFPRLDYD